MADDKKPSNYDEVMDAKMQVKKDAAYDAADSTPASPKSTAGAGQGMRGVKKMAMGGMARMESKGEHSVQKQAKRGAEIVKMAKGGLAAGHKSADGCAVRGKTRAMAPSMCGGGMAKGKR